jgi:hypothetical protein
MEALAAKRVTMRQCIEREIGADAGRTEAAACGLTSSR